MRRTLVVVGWVAMLFLLFYANYRTYRVREHYIHKLQEHLQNLKESREHHQGVMQEAFYNIKSLEGRLESLEADQLQQEKKLLPILTLLRKAYSDEVVDRCSALLREAGVDDKILLWEQLWRQHLVLPSVSTPHWMIKKHEGVRDAMVLQLSDLQPHAVRPEKIDEIIQVIRRFYATKIECAEILSEMPDEHDEDAGEEGEEEE